MVEIIKKLEKPFGQCQNSDRVREWREAHQRRQEALQSSKSVKGKLTLCTDKSTPKQAADKPLRMACASKPPLRGCSDEGVRQTPSARSASSSVTDSASTYGTKVSDRKRLFESSGSDEKSSSLHIASGSCSLKSNPIPSSATGDSSSSTGPLLMRKLPNGSASTSATVPTASARAILGRERRAIVDCRAVAEANDAPDLVCYSSYSQNDFFSHYVLVYHIEMSTFDKYDAFRIACRLKVQIPE